MNNQKFSFYVTTIIIAEPCSRDPTAKIRAVSDMHVTLQINTDVRI